MDYVMVGILAMVALTGLVVLIMLCIETPILLTVVLIIPALALIGKLIMKLTKMED